MQNSLFRILDANLNRFREAIRVLEDYARFTLNHTEFTQEFKTIRHQLVEFESTYKPQLLKARNTPKDVGTSLQGSHEMNRPSLESILYANFNRAKEAVRTLEEYSKTLSSDFAAGFEKARYALYHLESQILTHSLQSNLLQDRFLYVLLSPKQCQKPYLEVVEELIEGGVDILQLRMKEVDDLELLRTAETLREKIPSQKVLYIINDRPDIARLVQADGVHLGQEDLPPTHVRKHFPELLIGVSTHNLQQAEQAEKEGADYIGVGPVFPSKTKNFDHFAGLNFVEESQSAFKKPRFAIGGINQENFREVLAKGVSGLAMSAALTQAAHIQETTSFFKKELQKNQNR